MSRISASAPAGPAPYAAHPDATRGRVHEEPDPGLRTAYQRDRDRIIHCSAFRRLEYKTQVFVNHEGDMFRTRLTHSIEVAQIGRSIARALGLNEDLTEAVCLAHDLGHTPFGHAGQEALDRCMKEFGGFEHNFQSLRVVDVLEERYAAFPGLNLSFETREGILKHCSKARARDLGDLGRRFLDNTWPGAEAQVANLADEIAYNNHDVDDGLRAGLISTGQLQECTLFNRHWSAVTERWPEVTDRRLIHESVRKMINEVVTDVVQTSTELLRSHDPRSMDDVRRLGRAVIAMSEPVRREHLELKRFLHANLYRHYRVQRMSFKAARVVSTLFDTFMADHQLLPPDVRARMGERGDAGAARAARCIADYIAGMTDRYAITEFERLVDPRMENV